jgi:hypothetical protein
MMQFPMQGKDFDDIPTLTELVGEVIEIPVLTEVLAEETTPRAAQTATTTGLPGTNYRHLAAQIAPQLEALLRDSLAAQFDVLWQETWREAQARLPELIQTQLAAQQSNDNSAGSDDPTSAHPQGVGRGCTADESATTTHSAE